ncbi:MSC_0622 family F1-like ATPase gamma subunit [Mycoplasma sp. 1654_15]|uniref:MSC_0622 family F1-like ATPase gamma subunit n=1 Tax=Mycoplasma sp. 1654_15 TaxID=2725994 RepID=UPI001449689D|nr:hypothetical protein [Mycoplasma sp. 1654_15]QJB71547.1 hypothetical protein HF996_03775 [Mycoplasma sp. 1654_15]
MHLKKVIQKRDNLKKIHLKANSEKNILLISIIKLSQKLNFYVENVLLNKYAIINLSNKFNIKNEFITKRFLTKNKFLNKIEEKFFANKELWIYLKEEQKYSTDSYSRYEDLILETNKNVKLDFITIGEKANSFCVKNKLNVIKHFELNQKSFSTNLASIIKLLYVQDNYKKVRFVINSNKNQDNAFTILPIEDFDIDKLLNYDKSTNLNKLDEFAIIPDIDSFIQTSIGIYLQNCVQALINESSFYAAKNGLVKVNKIIKDLDETISKVSRKIIKIKRENEIEEIVLLTKNNSEHTVFNKGDQYGK